MVNLVGSPFVSISIESPEAGGSVTEGLSVGCASGVGVAVPGKPVADSLGVGSKVGSSEGK